jgi:cytochrome c biogenesis protein ResB
MRGFFCPWKAAIKRVFLIAFLAVSGSCCYFMAQFWQLSVQAHDRQKPNREANTIIRENRHETSKANQGQTSAKTNRERGASTKRHEKSN